jgi:hypothetical protein
MNKGIILLSFVLFIGFVNAGNYGAGTYGAGVFSVGEVPPVIPPVTPSGGGGGGGCTYNWDCTNWSPYECPATGIQERICINRGTCTDTFGMPNQTQSCLYEHKEPLFDIFLTIPAESREICAGRKINANINLENYGKIELLDAFMTYWIVDENNKLVSELKDTRSVSNEIDFNISMKIPGATLPGTYKLYAQITYLVNKTAVAGESFEIIDDDSCKIIFNISQYLPFILVGFGFLIVLILILILFRKLHHHLKQRRETGDEKRVETKTEEQIKKKEAQKIKPAKIKKIIRRPKPEKIGFFKRLRANRERRKKERASRRLLRELARQKKKAERENRLSQKRKQKEHKKQSRLQKRKQKKLEREYRRKVRIEKKMERKANLTPTEPAGKSRKKEKTEKPVSLQEDLMKQREI